MLDINFIRENPDAIRKDLFKRNDSEKAKLLDEFIELDNNWKKTKGEADALRARRNKVSEEINKAKKDKGDASAFIKEAQEIPQKLKQLEELEAKQTQRMTWIRMRLPNILHDSVPVGKDDSENVEVKKWGTIKKFNFELKPHGEITEDLGMADFKKAAKVSGAGFYYLKGDLAVLDLALQRFAIDHLIKKGFTLVEPPHMLTREAYEGVTDVSSFEDVMYKIEGDELFLIATSEHPLMALYKDEVIEEKDLPIKMVGISPCYRREIGSRGVDTKGIFRVHQFNKIEQVIICKPEDSWKIHEEVQRNSEEIFEALGLPYHVVSICTGDIGSVAAKKYDIEVWYPREAKYSEVTSASNCTSYQAVRSNIKYSDAKGKYYVHSLNNTGVATSRAMRAILENYQNADGTVDVPQALWPYMNGVKKLEKKK